MSKPKGSVSNLAVKSGLFAAGALVLFQAERPSIGLCEDTRLQAFPRFPGQKGDAAIAAWLKQSTSVSPADIILVGDGAVLAIEPGPPETTADGATFTHLREELTSPRLEQRLGGRSSTVSVSFDCAASQYKLSNPLVFKGSNLLGGPGRFMDPGDWIEASPDWKIELPKVFCGSGFKRPFDKTSDVQAPPTDQQLAKEPERPKEPSPSTHWVQAGAFPSVALAEAEWTRVKTAIPDTGTGHRTEAVTTPTGLYRLLIGPYDTKALAISACEALKRSKVMCFVR